MNGIAIYMEGGGDGAAGRRALRQGMDALLEPIKAVARGKAWHWKLVACGGRDRAFRAFRSAVRAGDYAVVALLVDSEEPVSDTPSRHVARRDGWQLAFAQPDSIHMMVQVMETWLLADQDTLRGYYGARFRASALPSHADLEDLAKTDVERALALATSGTSKGAYHKIRHASEILASLDRDLVRQRCPHFKRMWDWLWSRLA